MPLRGRSRTDLSALGLVVGALGMVLVVGLVTLTPSRQQGTELVETKTMSDQAWQEHLLRVRERQRQFEKEDTELMKKLQSRDHSVRAMLDSSHLASVQSPPAPQAKAASAQEFVFGPSAEELQLAKEEKVRERAAKTAEAVLAKVQKRREELLRVAVTQLTADKEKVVADVVGGGADANALAQARRRLIGDERLVVLLEASELAGGAGGAGAEAKKEPTPMIVRGHRHVADVLADNDAPLRKAGVKTDKDFAPWLMGMHEAREARERARHEEDGTKRLLKAGVAVDRLPGFGEDYRKAIPLPAFHDGLEWEQVMKGLESGHRPVSHGYEKMHRAGVNVNAPNLLVYGSQEHGTPKSDRSTTPFHYADGLEDAMQEATAARQHKPLSFVLHDLHRGSDKMESKGINVWGANVLKGLMHPEGVPRSWENRVPADRIHHPLVDGRDGEVDSDDESRFIAR